ncbi:MAG: TOBE domain-containing protein [Desulfobacter sp.]
MRQELRAIQQRTGVTFLYITHDQSEALAMSDRVGVMSQAMIEQVGTPDEVYNRPASPFVASFVGANNVFRGRVTRMDNGMAVLDTRFGALTGRVGEGSSLNVSDTAMLFVRPEDFSLANGSTDGLNIVSSRVRFQQFEGAFVNLHLENRDGRRDLTVQWTNRPDLPRLDRGQELRVGFRHDRAMVLPRGELANE